MRRLEARERRLIAVGLLVLAAALVWLAVAAPIIGGFSRRAETRRELLANYVRNRRLLGAIPAWRMQADEQRRTAAKFSIPAPGETLAAEALKERVARTVTAQGGAVQALSAQQADVAPGQVRVRADLQLTPSQLQESLRRLESEEPYVVVEHLSVAADQAFRTGRLGPMAVRLEVSALYRPAGAGQP